MSMIQNFVLGTIVDYTLLSSPSLIEMVFTLKNGWQTVVYLSRAMATVKYMEPKLNKILSFYI